MNLKTLQDQINKLQDELKSVKKSADMSKKFHAVIEDVKDPEKLGRVRLRVAGMHPSSKVDLPTDKLPWQKVVLPTGSGGGVGSSINMVVGQWVEVESANPASSAFNVIRNISTVTDGSTGDDAYGNVEETPKITNTAVPDIQTGDYDKLSSTIFSATNQSLLKFSTAGNGASGDTPELPPIDFTIVTETVDWSLDLEKEVSKFGKDLGHFLDYITIGGRLPDLNTISIELLNDGINNTPGNIIGYDYYGNQAYVTYIDNNLYVPPMVPPGEYTIRYKVTEIDSSPENSSINNIIITVVDIPTEIPRAIPRAGSIPSIEDNIQDHKISEPASTSDKAEYPYAKVDQGINNSVVIENDSTDGNRRYCITHMAEADNPSSLSRLEMNPNGDMIQKSANDYYIISKKNLLQYVENAVEQTIKGYLSINAPTILLKGNIRIEGNMQIEGDISQTGNYDIDGTLDSTTEVLADGVSLTTHIHGGVESGGATTAGPE